VGKVAGGSMSEEELLVLEEQACPTSLVRRSVHRELMNCLVEAIGMACRATARFPPLPERIRLAAPGRVMGLIRKA
jgi:DNA topoisomerase VI subunit A